MQDDGDEKKISKQSADICEPGADLQSPEPQAAADLQASSLDDETKPSLAGKLVSDEDLLRSRLEGEALLGQVIDNQFKVTEILGRGGMSVVYKADHLILKKVVAIKTMHSHMISDTGALLRFRQEAQAASQLDHANVIKVYHFGVTGGDDSRPYLVMDYIEGQSLSDAIDSGSLSVEAVLKIFVQVCNALEHAHAKGVIHRDLKPSNIMLLERDGDPYFVKIVDFGIAKVLPQEGEQAHRLTQTGEIFGSPMYMSPEQCMGRSVDKRSDMYALGCVLYEALSGKPPHEGMNVFETFHKHISDIPAPVEIANTDRALVERLDAIVFKALEKDPDKRYQDMASFEDDLRDVLRDLQSGIRGTSLRLGLARRQRSIRRFMKLMPRRAFAAVLAVLLLVFAAFSFWSTYNWFFQPASILHCSQTRWLDFLPATRAKVKVSADEKQKRLDDGRIALNFGKLGNADDSGHLLKLWRVRAEECAKLDAPVEEMEARRKIVSIMTDTGQRNLANFAPDAEALAECLIAQGAFREAQELLEQAIFVREKELMRVSRTYISLGYIYMKEGKYQASVVQLNEGLKQLGLGRAENLADSRQSAVAYAIIGDDYRLKGALKPADDNYKLAEKLLNQSLKAKKLNSSLIMLRELYLVRAYLSLQMGNYKDAVSYYSQSIAYAEEHFENQPEQLKEVLNSYAYSLWKLGDMLKAAEIRQKSKSI